MSDVRAPTHVNLAQKLGESPSTGRRRSSLATMTMKCAALKTDDEFVWHRHDETDELLLILEGEFDMDFRDRTVTLKAVEL